MGLKNLNIMEDGKKNAARKIVYGAFNDIKARNKSGSPMKDRLVKEIISASENEGEAVKKKENVHKMAESNRAFAHFSW